MRPPETSLTARPCISSQQVPKKTVVIRYLEGPWRSCFSFRITQRKFNMVEEAQMAEGNCSDSDKGDKVTVVTIEDEGSDFTPRDCIETDLPLEQEEGGSGS
ncbi:uncharacterized protein LOC111332781 isoform X2 [Stylophora pistillata]|uniref:uncharacterized protein LOC111332781 isoform X2 n=1 Tax=Stylophora pistillata TaxID=50429 RepID=UPI000C03F334|nr:uncharacterized protein LOC111332781 isoform X2 [Stylophora pistillata]